ncbi:hypothetical protein N9M08_10080, partial [Porticoccaceae bacterium]|nr:hypothetical protein [Porticoccaceae bacterium]
MAALRSTILAQVIRSLAQSQTLGFWTKTGIFKPINTQYGEGYRMKIIIYCLAFWSSAALAADTDIHGN